MKTYLKGASFALKPLAMPIAMVGLAAGGAAPALAEEPANLWQAIAGGDPILEFRPRYEGVDQAGKLDTEAYTLRTRLGWKTQDWMGVSALLEIENIAPIAGDYNDGLNGKTAYATIGDPDVTEIQRLQLLIKPAKWFKATIGRQKLDYDDKRLIGSPAWRQDAVSFDAARLDMSVGKAEISYTYVDKMNRSAAEEADLKSDSHLLNVSYKVDDWLKVIGYAYAIDVSDSSPAQSNFTWGGRIEGEAEAGPVDLEYSGTWARQTDYGGQPRDYDLGFWDVLVEGGVGPASLALGYESNEGDGVGYFLTPFQAAHNFSGFTDAFNNGGGQSTRDGLDAFNVVVKFEPEWEAGPLSDFKADVTHYDYKAERTGMDFGEEWSTHLTVKAGKKTTLMLAWADYEGPDVAPAPASRTKTWLQAEFKY
jgi:hypothetical protein